MLVKTKTVAKHSPQKVGAVKRNLINQARQAIAREANGGEPAPEYMEVPDSWGQAHRGRRAQGMQAQPVTLTARHVEIAKQLGEGNISAGVRMALEKCQENAKA
jgi:hypothetical protein